MNVLNGIEFTEPTHSACVWRGDPCRTNLRGSWESLIARQNAPCTIYQSPSFFEYLAATEGLHNLDILTVENQSTGLIVGIVPVQKLSFQIPFSLGSHSFFKVCLPGLRVLGSEPMIPKTREAHDRLFALIAGQYRDLQVVEMDKVSADGFLWQYLFSSPFIRENYFVHVLHGVRDCHFVHLPPSIEEYRRQLGRKLRHNFERQERVLERHLKAPLSLTLLNREEHVPIIIKAMKALGARGNDDPATERGIRAATRYGFHYCFILCAGDRIVGMTSGTRSKGTYRIHKFFYDKRLENYSPGTTMWHRVLRFLIEDATFQNVDMGYGTPVYSHRSINTVYKTGTVLLFQRTIANRCLIAAHSAFSTALNIFKMRTAFPNRG